MSAFNVMFNDRVRIIKKLNGIESPDIKAMVKTGQIDIHAKDLKESPEIGDVIKHVHSGQKDSGSILRRYTVTDVKLKPGFTGIPSFYEVAVRQI